MKTHNLSFYSFAYNFAEKIEQSEWGTKFIGVKRKDELKYLMDGVMIRHKKKDVLADLPDKIHNIIWLDSEDTKFKKLVKEEEALLEYLNINENTDLSILKKHDVKFEKIMEIRRKIGMAKVPLCMSYINEELLLNEQRENKKILIYTIFRDVAFFS